MKHDDNFISSLVPEHGFQPHVYLRLLLVAAARQDESSIFSFAQNLFRTPFAHEIHKTYAGNTNVLCTSGSHLEIITTRTAVIKNVEIEKSVS